MKKMLWLFLLTGMILRVNAQELKSIKLNSPDKNRGITLMKALEKRQSVREYADRTLSVQDLSDLLWAANGVNRQATGKRTAPSALNAQDVDVYVCMSEGAYLYDAVAQILKPVVKRDLRPMIAGTQAFVDKAPVCLVLVSDLSRFKKGDKENLLIMAAIDAGVISQNISLFCAATGLATVPRAYMDKNKLITALKLKESQYLLLNHPVGYMK